MLDLIRQSYILKQLMTEMIIECKNKTDFIHALDKAADDFFYSDDFRSKSRFMI